MTLKTEKETFKTRKVSYFEEFGDFLLFKDCGVYEETLTLQKIYVFEILALDILKTLKKLENLKTLETWTTLETLMTLETLETKQLN